MQFEKDSKSRINWDIFFSSSKFHIVLSLTVFFTPHLTQAGRVLFLPEVFVCLPGGLAGGCFWCRLVFCNYKDPICDFVHIYAPKSVGGQCKGIVDLWPLTFVQLPWTLPLLYGYLSTCAGSPISHAVQICSPKGVGVLYIGMLDLSPLTFMQLPPLLCYWKSIIIYTILNMRIWLNKKINECKICLNHYTNKGIDWEIWNAHGLWDFFTP